MERRTKRLKYAPFRGRLQTGRGDRVKAKGITRRWLVNSLGLVLVVVVALEIGLAFFIKTFYYNSARQTIDSRTTVMKNYIVKSADNVTDSNSAYIRNLVETFTDKDIIELMAIDKHGNVQFSSSGFQPASNVPMPDYEKAKASKDREGEYIGKLSGEKIIAVTIIIPPESATGFSALRFVSSLEDVDRQIMSLILIFIACGVSAILLVIFTSSYFIRSIVVPVREVGKAASKIAAGDFGARIDKKCDDEIGELCDIINYMANELSNADKMKNDFISSVSHELRTPLTAIKGWGETLMSCTPGDVETIAKGMRVIIGETERLSSMVEELLDFSRMQSGRLTLVMSKIDILAEIGEAYIMFTERAKREGIEIEYHEPEMLSPIFGDKNRLRQVFINVIDNALKYSNEGDKVRIESFEQDEFIYIVVSDTGCGISPQDLPNVKNKFFKGNLSRRGSGIGLAVADEIMTLHGGALLVQSELGVGTTVTIKIPVINKLPGELPTS